MTINKTKENGVLTIAPVGRLDSSTSDEFSTAYKENISDDVEKLIIDLADVDFISSKGLRIFVSIYKELSGKPLEIINANTSVKEIFRLSGLLKIFDVK